MFRLDSKLGEISSIASSALGSSSSKSGWLSILSWSSSSLIASLMFLFKISVSRCSSCLHSSSMRLYIALVYSFMCSLLCMTPSDLWDVRETSDFLFDLSESEFSSLRMSSTMKFYLMKSSFSCYVLSTFDSICFCSTDS